MSVAPSNAPTFPPVPGGAWRGLSGSMVVSRPTQASVVVTMRGHVEIRAGEILHSVLSRELAAAVATVYWDIAGMCTYHSDVRARAIKLMREESARIAGIHAIATSRLAAVGVLQTNLALGGRMTVHSNYESFVAALARAGVPV